MKMIVNVVILAGVLAFVVAIISRMTMTPLTIVPGGLEAEAILSFANTCLLIAAVLLLNCNCTGKGK